MLEDEDPEVAWEEHPLLAEYRPKGIEPEVWDHPVRPFVADVLRDVQPPGHAAAAKDRRDLARLAAWAHGLGFDLDREVVLSPAMVEQHVTTWGYTPKMRMSVKSNLSRIGRLTTKTAPWVPKPSTVGYRSVAVPYPPGEVEMLWRMASQQPTEVMRQGGQAVIALGAGIGLDGRWNTKIAGTDVCRVGDVVLVHVPEPHARTVAVLDQWADRIEALAHEAGENLLTGKASTNKNRASRLQARTLMPKGAPLLSAGRLRSTWMVTHMSAGTRLPELVAAAGTVGVTTLSDLLCYVEPMQPPEAWEEVRRAA